MLECVGILGNLTLPDLDFTRILKEFEMIDWMRERIVPNSGEDDLILEIVVFIGTCATDSAAASFLCKCDILPSLIDLLKAKQEDDEIVLQVIYVFHQLCSHKETKKFVLEETEAIPYLLDLLHDRNPEVQKVCDSTLQMIGEVSPDWSQRLLGEKFRFHNAQARRQLKKYKLRNFLAYSHFSYGKYSYKYSNFICRKKSLCLMRFRTLNGNIHKPDFPSSIDVFSGLRWCSPSSWPTWPACARKGRNLILLKGGGRS